MITTTDGVQDMLKQLRNHCPSISEGMEELACQQSIIRDVFITKAERLLGLVRDRSVDQWVEYTNVLWSKYTDALKYGWFMAFDILWTFETHIHRWNLHYLHSKFIFVDGNFHGASLHISIGTALEKTERQFGDDYVTLLVHFLMDCQERTGQDRFLFQAILTLELALERSKSNFQFKLLLIRIYIQLGMLHGSSTTIIRSNSTT